MSVVRVFATPVLAWSRRKQSRCHTPTHPPGIADFARVEDADRFIKGRQAEDSIVDKKSDI